MRVLVLLLLSAYLVLGVSGGKKGASWKNTLYFDSDIYNTSVEIYNIRADELIIKLIPLVGADEQIRGVTAVKKSLFWWQITYFYLYHMFVVFETDKWWWSIEKSSDGITLQRSKYPAAVYYLLRKEIRPLRHTMKTMKSDYGTSSVHGLIAWLYHNDEINTRYHYIKYNCKHFATDVFNLLSKTKWL
ncbi:hypothetical protein DPMN_155316 [Dreissena polymorpha]|uniref:DUF4105 domain-containing protein n=1 Tax=Dreissena polymorpha TaxID=45954 RepID=A0A9D4FQZ6_DREPO|nr:hypothetical protein DPMN_155316 [Dreissena polymorpha]